MELLFGYGKASRWAPNYFVLKTVCCSNIRELSNGDCNPMKTPMETHLNMNKDGGGSKC